MKNKNNNKIALVFNELSSSSVDIAGGKGASLGEMARSGIPVPQGFVILSNTFETFLEETDLNIEINAILNSVNHKEVHTVENASEKIQALILNAEIPENITQEIKKFFKNLDAQYVAVRSSATAEDSSSAAWAGQLDSYLNTTEENLLENVKKCWASLFTPRAIFYRFEKDLHKQKISVAVVVQKMVNSELSGIAFSVHPVTQDRNQLIIEAGFGLGEAIVSGSVTPDSYVVEKEPKNILNINVYTQEKALYRVEGGGNEWKKISEPKASSQVLTKDQILELSNIILGIEKHYGFPCDIEWAFEKEEFYIVQSRPITTLQTKNQQVSIEEFIIPRVRELTLAPAYWNTVLQTNPSVEKNYGKKLSLEYCFYFGGQMNVVIPKRDWNQIGEYVSEQLVNDKNYFENIEERTEMVKQNILTFITENKETDLSKLSFQNLTHLAEKIKTLFMDYDSASLFTWFVAGDLLKKKIGARLELSGDDLDIIALPEEQTFATQMEREVIEGSLDKNNEKQSSKDLADKYYWIPFGYDGPSIWNDEHFVHRIKEFRNNKDETKTKYDEIVKRDKELKEKVKTIIEKRNFGKEEKWLIHILRSSAIWTDERKMLDFQLFFLYNNVLLEFEKRYKISVVHLKYLFTNELVDLEKNTEKLEKLAEQRIKKEFMLISESGDVRIATDLELQRVREIIDRQSQKSDIRGNVACRGAETKYIANVKVLRSSKECSKVEKGEILVATMTTPDYVLAMNRALGFITDEGGVTCHAAIIAREMNKPCIIGTKNATQLLKDGDKIEMDVLNGSVRILK